MALTTKPQYTRLVAGLRAHFSSGSAVQEAAACMLLDLCAGPALAGLLPAIISRVDEAMDVVIECTPFIAHNARDPSKATAVVLLLKLAVLGQVSAAVGHSQCY